MPPPPNDPLSLLVRATARGRVTMARHPQLYWIAIGSIAIAAAVGVHHELQRVASTRASWGTPHRVLVAVRDVGPGEPLVSAVAERTLPDAAVPESAIEALPAGATAQHPLGAGEVLLAHHVAPGAGLASRLPAGTSGVALTKPVTALPLSPGDLVDVIAIDDPLGASGAPAGSILARGAPVVSVTEGGAVIAVADDAAPAAAAALAGGRAVLVLARSVAMPDEVRPTDPIAADAGPAGGPATTVLPP